MPYLILGVFYQGCARPYKRSPWKLYRSVGGVSAGMTLKSTLYPGSSFEPGIRALAVWQNGDGSFSDKTVTLEWTSSSRVSITEIEVGQFSGQYRKVLSTLAELIRLRDQQKTLLCELAGGLVAKATGEFGLLVPKEKEKEPEQDAD